MAYTVAPVRSEADLDAVKDLFRDYVAWLAIDLTFQGFEAELADLPGKYAPPGGELFLARRDDGVPLGCVALRPFDRPGACEVKRLYLRDAGRGTGVGRALAARAVSFAEAAGYREMLLDTLPAMAPAIALYRSLGFVPIPPYYANPIPDVLYFGKRLGDG